MNKMNKTYKMCRLKSYQIANIVFYTNYLMLNTSNLMLNTSCICNTPKGSICKHFWRWNFTTSANNYLKRLFYITCNTFQKCCFLRCCFCSCFNGCLSFGFHFGAKVGIFFKCIVIRWHIYTN